ncbi:MAG TPA: hypothetical protein VHU82_14940 [Vicinamibacterales bacterium]|nr:hypothetical protein [Vicinamibacterales bacterium]
MFDIADSKPSILDRLACRVTAWRAWRSPFAVLCRTFLGQFFTSEVVSSDMRLRQAISGVLAFLLMPGLMMTGGGMTELQNAQIRAQRLHVSGMLEPVFAHLAAALITYSMVVVSFLSVLEWDALGFDRRDALVLGSLPVSGAAVIGAKLVALSAFVVGTSVGINLLPTASFAWGTAALLGPVAFARYLPAYVCATVGSAVLVCAVVVTLRGAVALLIGTSLAARTGALLKFVSVGTLLAFLTVVVTARPGHARVIFFAAGSPWWMPTGWFLALFERIRGVTQPEVVARAHLAVLGTGAALAGAILVSILGFRRQNQLALAPSASVGAFASVRIGRLLVRWLTAGDRVARATADFILLTLARNRAQQELIAINMALGAAVVIGGLARAAQDWQSLMQPRTALFWIPLVFAYTMTIGLRASFFVPSDLPAAWMFRASGPDSTASYWSATRASMLVVIVPPTALMTAAICAPLIGWRMAAIHTLSSCVVISLLIEVVALTVTFVPYTRAYPPGHANLKTLWWLYALGLFVFAYWPARVELASISRPVPLLEMTASLVLIIAVLEIVGRRRSVRRRASWQDADDSTVTVLDIGPIASAASHR